MAEQIRVEGKKSIWRWLVSGTLFAGVAMWGGVQWLGTAAIAMGAGAGVAVKTGAIATGVLAAATAFTFSFGDKVDLSKYVKEVSGLVKDGQKTEAVEYMDRLIVSLDRHVAVLEKEARADPNGAKAPEKNAQKDIVRKSTKAQSLGYARLCRKVAELLRMNVRHAAGKMSQEDWLAGYEKILNTNPDDSGRIVSSVISLSGKEFSFEDVLGLIRKPIPSEARGKLAFLWLALTNISGQLSNNDDVLATYAELLAYLGDTRATPVLLRRAVADLDNRNMHAEANEILDSLISVFPETGLGAIAARLRLGAIEPGQARDERILALVEEYPKSVISEDLHGLYISVLMKRKQFTKALAAIDNKRLMEKIATEEEGTEVLLSLAREACKIETSTLDNIPIRQLIKDRLSGSSSNAVSFIAPLCPLVVCADLAEQFLAGGDYPLAVGLNFTVLKSLKSLPLNLITGRPIRSPLDVADITNPGTAKYIAKYFAALVQYALVMDRRDVAKEAKDLAKKYSAALVPYMLARSDAGDRLSGGLLQAPLPTGIRPYVLLLMTHRAAAANDWDSAVRYAAEALQILPNSLPLLAIQADITKAERQLAMRAQIEKDIRRCLDAARSAKAADEAIRNYEKAGQLSIALGNTEQAVGAYLQIAERYPEHAMAPRALIESIRILNQTGKPQYAQRIKSLGEKLLKNYSDSPQAREYKQNQAKQQ